METPGQDKQGDTAEAGGGCAITPGPPGGGNEVSVVGVRLQGQARVQQFGARDVDFEIGDLVMVKGERGLEVAEVAQATTRSRRGCGLSCLRPVLRAATETDVHSWNEARGHETDAYEWCRARIRERSMPMRLVRVEQTAESHKLTFLFTAEGRVDFRELVRDLAQKFRQRIEMRQIGVRDEAAAGGGYGPCGRSLCCSTFLKGFAPISIKMAKAQKLSLNPSKLSGMCGRLKCCLRYE
ncbi:MAG TPA: regulatory iron-sulfur-containing complex subunit RicT, partial [Candidatus Polarisedimenticolia bacterium]|nr:regulatory iron-sulfur-containing complex subunit RicT [Candidatus Polarisedimenticolia bacterium]